MSSKVFAYNQASPVDKVEKGVFELTFGLFFDGTKNNRRNTEIRKKVKGLDGYGNPTQKEKKIYNKKAFERSYKSLWLDKKEIGDDSFANDFTNVARMTLCLIEEYAIYVEGSGTEDEKSDSTIGYALGSGPTGIRSKVREGCKKLAEIIAEKKDDFEEEEITLILHIDTFGFSRGAAAARNFLYEIQKKAYNTEVMRRYTRRGVDGISYYVKENCDSDGFIIREKHLLKDEKLPPLGHLGVELMRRGFSWEKIEKIKIKPRFLGLYDTVSSYSKSINPFPNFKNDVKELQLNNFGRVKKAVHFTAQDEHRENFALTRMSGGIEKNFPGVHSDIGGSYTNGEEIVEIENGPLLSLISLKNFRLKLIGDHWFKPSQIELLYLRGLIALQGKRDLKKEYSYIPLHFMKDHAEDYIKDYIKQDIEVKYDITKDSILVQAKKRLESYVMGDGEEWKFISDEEIKRQKKLKALKKALKEESPEKARQRRLRDLMEKREMQRDRTRLKEVRKPVPNNEFLERLLLEAAEEKNRINIDGITVTGYTSQGLLRKLRNEYLHWSANRKGIGMDPVTSRKRVEY